MLMKLNYLKMRTLFKFYKLYWLLILPYDYSIRPYSTCFGGESALEKCFKYDHKSTSAKTKARDCCCRSYLSVRVYLVVFAIVFGLLLTVYGAVVLGNYISPVESETQATIGEVACLGNVSTSTQQCFGNATRVYPVCDMSWNADLSVLDLSYFIQIVYDIKDNPQEQPVSMQQVVSMYFDGDYDVESGFIYLNESALQNPTWRVVHYTTEEPVFMHLRNDEEAVDIISVRGTLSISDLLQDLNLYISVVTLQLASMVVPITSLVPDSFVMDLVYFASYFEGLVDDTLRDSYDRPVYDYAYSVLSDYVEEGTDIESLYFVGHSLGGGIGQVVAAQFYYMNRNFWRQNMEIKSVSIASPGLVFGSKKFGVDLDSLYSSSAVIVPTFDLASKIDVHAGLVQHIGCGESSFAQCHLLPVIGCQLFDHCQQKSSLQNRGLGLYNRQCHGEVVAWSEIAESAVLIM